MKYGSLTKDALYAMRYDPDGLAQRAYDARLYRYGSQYAARSPAIDAGSDDAYGYDTTSTHPKVIDMGQPDIGYHYYRRVADDDPVDNQLIEFTFRQPEVGSGMTIHRYIVPNPVNTDQELHEITSTDRTINGTLQEGFLGKDVVVGTLKGYVIPKGQHLLELKTEITDSRQSVSASLRLIIDPDPPEVAVQ